MNSYVVLTQQGPSCIGMLVGIFSSAAGSAKLSPRQCGDSRPRGMLIVGAQWYKTHVCGLQLRNMMIQ